VSSSFARSRGALERDSAGGYALSLLISVIILTLWVCWLAFAETSVYAVSESANVEVSSEGYPVQADVAGRVISTRLALGKEVHAGEVLLELDATAERLQSGETRARGDALPPQIAAIERQVDEELRAGNDEQLAAQAAADEARERVNQREAALRLAQEDAARARRLYEGGLTSVAELRKVETGLREIEAEMSAAQAVLARAIRQRQALQSDRQARVQELQAERSRLEGEQKVAAAALARLGHEIERRQIVAPISGALGEVAQINAGTVVTEGQPIATVVPGGHLRVAASFAPSVALGRVRPSQPARIRLDGFPWVQYGTVAATVTQVANEVRDGHVRVELEIDRNPRSAIPIQHGLPGIVEVEVERASPAALVLRAAGRLVTDDILHGSSSNQ
jgi:membrane fusion protein (multidrug efflux system)